MTAISTPEAAVTVETFLAGTPVTSRRLDAAGIATAVLEGGAGPPVVLLHGPAEAAVGWLNVMPALAPTHRVVAPDLPGHGDSASAADLGLDRLVAWLDDVIAATCPAPPIVVGRVLGGALAVRFGAAHGEHVAGLVLVDTFGLSPFEPAPPFGEALHRFLVDPTEHTHDQLMRYCSYDFDAVRRQLGDTWSAVSRYVVERVRRPALQQALTPMMRDFGTPIPESVLARLSVPVALIWGRHDLATPLHVAETASRTFGWPLHVIEEAADDPALDQPEAFVGVLRDACDEIGATR